MPPNIPVLVSMETKKRCGDPEALLWSLALSYALASRRHLPLIAAHSRGALQRRNFLTWLIRRNRCLCWFPTTSRAITHIFKTSIKSELVLEHRLKLSVVDNFECVAFRKSPQQLVLYKWFLWKLPLVGTDKCSCSTLDPHFDLNYDSNTPVSSFPIVLLHNGIDPLYCLRGCVLLFSAERLIC